MSPKHVTVYGNDHSPWVQAVLLGLHDRGIAHTLVTVPPLRVFLDSGVLMPAAQIDDGAWRLDSAAILAALGYSEVAEEDARSLRRLFASSALRRTDDAWAFWSRFSFARDGHPNGLRRHWNHFWRAFSILYFFTLIRVGGPRMAPRDSESGRKALRTLQARLPGAHPFFGGDAPDTVDLQLFGLVQMFSSIPVPELAILQKDPELECLRRWVGEMQRRFSGYGHLYAAADYEPVLPTPPGARGTERIAFWLGALAMWLAFPITLPLVAIYAGRVRKTGRVGGVGGVGGVGRSERAADRG
jgi:glutathione S-transferase